MLGYLGAQRYSAERKFLKTRLSADRRAFLGRVKYGGMRGFLGALSFTDILILRVRPRSLVAPQSMAALELVATPRSTGAPNSRATSRWSTPPIFLAAP